MKLAILGGSFNPLHLGHIMLAHTAISQCGFEQILFIPAYDPPHKDLADGATTQDRLTMLTHSLTDYPQFTIEQCELTRKGISYTIDTITYLEQKYAHTLTGKIGIIIGNDLAPTFHLWKDADTLAKKTDILLASRPDTTEKKDHTLNFPHITLKNTPIPISSAEIRQRIYHKKEWKTLVPNYVYKYITDRNLYATNY